MKLHKIKGANLENIERLTEELDGALPDWVPAIIDGPHFSGYLRELSYGIENWLGDILDEAAERLDQAHEEWAMNEVAKRQPLLNRDEKMLINELFADKIGEAGVAELWLKLCEARQP